MGASSVRRFAGQLAATTAVAGILVTSAQAQQNIPLPGIDVTSSRLGQGIVGTSTSIITAEEIARSPSSTLAGHPVPRARHSGDQPVRRRERRRQHGRHARFRRGRRIQHVDPHQRPPHQRSRSRGGRSCGDPARQHRAHRDHARQQRRGALWRRRGRRRDQHRDQVGRGAAAEGTVRGRIRLVQAARRQRRRSADRAGRGRQASMAWP